MHDRTDEYLPPDATVLRVPDGDVAERYEVLAEVGRGAMGVVYRARHRTLNTLVALKVMLPGASADRFRREALLLARVRSPHVVAVHDFGVRADGRPVLVMDWVDGTTLDAVLTAARKPLPEARVLPWMRQVAEGMLAAADQGITHRDLKPANILIDRDDRARVADFGIARGPAPLPELTAAGAVIGTPHYMAPEQAESPHGVDTRADVYSFGATFYHALTGAVPFDGESAFSVLFRHKVAPLVSPRARNAKLSERTAAVLERCLAKNPAGRFPSFAVLLRHLQPAPAAEPVWEEADPADGYRPRYLARRPVYLDPAQRAELTAAPDVYLFADGRAITVTAGDLTAQPRVDAVVSPDNELLSMSTGVARLVRDAAGADVIRADVRKYPPVRAGRVVVTAAGKLAARFVFHAVVGATLNERAAPSRDLLTEVLHGCVYHADALEATSLALPLLGTESRTFPEDVCLDTLLRFWARTLAAGATAVRQVRIVLPLPCARPRRRRPPA